MEFRGFLKGNSQIALSIILYYLCLSFIQGFYIRASSLSCFFFFKFNLRIFNKFESYYVLSEQQLTLVIFNWKWFHISLHSNETFEIFPGWGLILHWNESVTGSQREIKKLYETLRMGLGSFILYKKVFTILTGLTGDVFSCNSEIGWMNFLKIWHDLIFPIIFWRLKPSNWYFNEELHFAQPKVTAARMLYLFKILIIVNLF